MHCGGTFFLGALLCASVSRAQPTIDWQRNYGGSFIDQGSCIVPTSDGGYIVLGETRSSDGQVTGFHGGLSADLWLMKINGQGSLLWQRCLGGSGPEVAGSIAETQDGGYIVVGSTASLDGDVSENLGGADIWLVRLSTFGDVLWEQSYGGSQIDSGERVIARQDGTFWVGGYTFSMDGDAGDNHGASDFWLGHVSQNGTLLQSRCFGGTRFDHLRDMYFGADGGLVMGGVTNSNDGDVTDNPEEGNDAWVVYLANGWDITWQKVLGGSGDDQVRGLFKTQGDTVFAAITAYSLDGDITDPWGGGDYWIIKLGSDGTLLGERSFGGSGQDSARPIIPDPTGRFIYVSGRSSSSDGLISAPHGATDCWTLCLNFDLDLVWEKSHGGSQGDGGNALCIASDGGLVIAGFSQSNDGDLMDNFGASDVWVVKLDPQNVGMEYGAQQEQFRVFPNPATNILNVQWDVEVRSLTVHDTQGKLVASVDHLPTGLRQHQLNVENWADGLYTVQLNGASGRIAQRFAKH